MIAIVWRPSNASIEWALQKFWKTLKCSCISTIFLRGVLGKPLYFFQGLQMTFSYKLLSKCTSSWISSYKLCCLRNQANEPQKRQVFPLGENLKFNMERETVVEWYEVLAKSSLIFTNGMGHKRRLSHLSAEDIYSR